MKSIENKKTKFSRIVLVLLLFLFITSRQAEDRNPMIPLTVMTYNIGDLNGHKPSVEDIAKVIKSRGVPDLILVQEIENENLIAGLSMALGLDHYVYAKSKDEKSDLAIISRNALLKSDVYFVKANDERRPALAAELIIGGQKVLVCSVHLDRIEAVKDKYDRVELSLVEAVSTLKEEIFEDTVRSRSAEELVSWLESRQYEYIIIGGDFNTVPFSKTIRIMGQAFNDALRTSTDYLNGSYIKSSLPIKPRVDFIFHSPSMECRKASIIRSTAGDHYPIHAVFDLPHG